MRARPVSGRGVGWRGRYYLGATVAVMVAVSSAGAVPGRPGAGAGVQFTVEPFLQDPKPDGVIVSWVTNVPTSGVVRVDLPTSRAAFVSTPGTDHRVRLSGLAPGTRYSYVVAARRVGDDSAPETLAAPGELATVPLSGPFMFLVYGDNRDRDADHFAVIQAMLPEHPDFVLQTGDMVSRASDDGQWHRYFATAAPLLHNVPIFPALGNHELRFDPEAYHFFRYFALPAGGTHRRRPVYYSFRYSNAVFIAIDGNSPYDNEQASWLERELGAAQIDPLVHHVFLFVHQPPYAVGAYCGSDRLQRRIVPLIIAAQQKVRAVFGGHEHAYQHLERQGIRYFVSGGGGAPLYYRSQSCNAEDDLALQLFRAEHHYLRVQVDGDAATLTAISKTSEVMERVLLNRPVAPDKFTAELPPKLIAAPEPPAPSARHLESVRVDADADAESKLDGEPDQPLPQLRPATATTTLPPAHPARRAPRAPALVALLWLSGLALLAGLLLLTRPAPRRRRRADLQPSARRPGPSKIPGDSKLPSDSQQAAKRQPV